MTISSLTNQTIGLARDFHKSIRRLIKRPMPGVLPGIVWKENIIKDLKQCGYFTDIAIENYAEALVLLMETSDPKRKE